MYLSKSKYCSGIQCRKLLWLKTYHPDEANPDAIDQARLDDGTAVGDLAMGYFGDYQEVPYQPDDFEGMAALTSQLMQQGAPVICEATFIHDDNLCMVDILKKDGDGWQLIEVKGTTSGTFGNKKEPPIKDVFLDDIAFQYWVLTQCDVSVTSAHLMHLNPDYRRDGDLDLPALFAREDVTEQIRELQSGMASQVADIKKVSWGKTEPARPIGVHCDTPYECPFKRHCWGDLLDQQTVFTIYRIGKKEAHAAFADGIVTFADVKARGSHVLSKNSPGRTHQIEQIELELQQRDMAVNQSELDSFLGKLNYPLYFLDFEAFAQPSPPFDGLKPYDAVPFQYSLHVQREPGAEPTQFEFLAQEGTDPRRAIAEDLCTHIPVDANLVAFNATYEQRCLAALAECVPDLREQLLAMKSSFTDLLQPFQSHAVHLRGQHGSKSIKKVLPAICPDDPSLDYQNLESINKGDQAGPAFLNLTSMGEPEREQVRQDLLDYCRLDTLGMVKIVDQLWNVSREADPSQASWRERTLASWADC